MTHPGTVGLNGPTLREGSYAGDLVRNLVIGLMAFLTVVDLFATQAILPSLAQAYGVSAATISFAVNATTLGMALGGLGVALLGRRIDRRRGVVVSLLLLAIPTALLGTLPDLMTFAALRVLQGICMAAAFTLTLAYLGEACSASAAAGAFAAYVTGNVASNLVGRLVAAALVDHLGLVSNFIAFALLNLAGAGLAVLVLRAPPPKPSADMGRHGQTSPFAVWAEHFANPTLLAAFGIGFCILFAFLGTFTFVNFVLIGSPFLVGPMMLGFVYFVFLPSLVITPLAGRVSARLGLRRGLAVGLLIAGLGLPLLTSMALPLVLAGLVLVGVGTFLAQAIATSVVGRSATGERTSASGLYLFFYYLGGLAGTAVLGQVFERWGWGACVLGVAASLALAAALTLGLREPSSARGVT
ncbi:MFS transporter [Methylorubrum populi]|jgi:YNFM family putative membrane transporter|uniref:Major facilitator superfamily protein n=2 Tax=Methylobacteriaceae TaxID=119045 RepID=A0A160PLN6_9HYPH|nr:MULTISPECIES: MFS transporter [Methylobacteriaceae]MBY0256399.1 MFS transporter [Methylobacterium sp.]MCB4802775.1 MFS transporter [Methylobacterium brachiatum]MDQ0543409.1 putative MFS family arabinose efflux permease [Methylobacterium brachiatum]BAU94065.1 major facilitator superfamily protein [Methylorubrum populi]